MLWAGGWRLEPGGLSPAAVGVRPAGTAREEGMEGMRPSRPGVQPGVRLAGRLRREGDEAGEEKGRRERPEREGVEVAGGEGRSHPPCG